MNDVDVVISVYSIDRADDVVECINSVRQQTFSPKEIIVVLDPDDALVSYYTKHLDSDVKIIISDAFGLCSARNMGIKNSNSEFVAFIDDDAVAVRDWLEKLVSNFNDQSVIAVGGKILPVWPKDNPSWFPEELYWIVGCSYKGLPIKKAVIRNPIGCNMVFRSSVFEKAGFFSTNVGRIGNNLLGHDDTEFGVRAVRKIAGTRIIYEPEAVVHHRVSQNRVSLKYVLKRSYAEGFSKAKLINNDIKIGNGLGTESNYLSGLIRSTIILLTKRDKIIETVNRIPVLSLSVSSVLLGYFAGSLS